METLPKNTRKLFKKLKKNLDSVERFCTFGENQIMEVQGRALTFGEMAAGVTFNPGGNQDVNDVKYMFAAVIDKLNELRNAAEGAEKKRMYSVAITEAQTSQMWAVKAITWQF